MSHEETEHQEPSRDDKARNEKVLHTRIPASLEDEIKRLADALAIPVSNLVRNILQDTVGMVGTVADHVGGVVTGLRDDAKTLSSHVVADRDHLRRRWAEFQARQARKPDEDTGGEPPSPEEAPKPGLEAAGAPAAVEPEATGGTGAARDLDGVFGWQPLTLNIETTCALCPRELSRGAEAYLGLGGDPTRRIFICPGCVPRA